MNGSVLDFSQLGKSMRISLGDHIIRSNRQVGPLARFYDS